MASRIAELETENDQLCERIKTLEQTIGDDPGANAANPPEPATPAADESEGPSVSRRGALGVLASLGVLGMASQPASAAGQQLNFGESVAGDTASGVGLNLSETSSTGGSIGLRGISDSDSGRGLVGVARADAGNAIGVIGNSQASGGRGIVGKATAKSGNTVGLLGFTESVSGTGLQGTARATTGNTVGLRGRTLSPNSTAVLGNAANGSGATTGVYGKTASNIGIGVRGEGSFAGVGGITDRLDGVKGIGTDQNSFTHGVHGTSRASAGLGVFGEATHSSGFTAGVYGQTASNSGRGVFGEAVNGSGTPYGVEGTSSADNFDSFGVRGEGPQGVYGTTSRNLGNGVRGVSTASSGASYGVRGDTSSPHGYGVYARNSGGGVALRASGDFEATGTKNFVEAVETEDGPQEVVYTATEAGRAMTEITDIAQLKNGRAEVDLPAHFVWVTSKEESLSVETTPYSIDSSGLAVTERSVDQIVVEDMDGAGNYEFSYTVKGTRRGYADKEVVREPKASAAASTSTNGQGGGAQPPTSEPLSRPKTREDADENQ
jgi:hypothetical protein